MQPLVPTFSVLVVSIGVAAASLAPAASERKQTITGANPVSVEQVRAAVDRLFAPWDNSHSPGCGLAVSRHGAVVYERGYGMANLVAGRHYAGLRISCRLDR